MSLLKKADLEDSPPPWYLALNMRQWAGGDASDPASSTASDLDRPVYLPSTSQGGSWLHVFEDKSTALRLLSCMRQRRATFCALGDDGQVSVQSVCWTKLLVFDSFCPYLQRLFQAFTPIYAGGETWFVSRVTSEAETLADALRNVGRRVKSDSLNSNEDLRAAGIHMIIVDYNYRYADKDTRPSSTSQLRDSAKLLTYHGVWPNDYFLENVAPGNTIQHRTILDLF